MAISKEKKQAQIEVLRKAVSEAHAVTVAVNHGIKSNEMNELRKKAREGKRNGNEMFLYVPKNNLANIVFKDSEQFSVICEDLKEPVILGFSMDDLSSATKLLGDFAAKNKKMTIKAAAIEGTRYGQDEIKFVMNLPNREQAIGMVVLGVKSPLVQFTGVLQELYGQFARVLHAVSEQKQD